MAEQHLHSMKSFVQEYSATVVSMEESMAEQVSLVWDTANDPIGLLTEPFEAKRVQDLFSSGKHRHVVAWPAAPVSSRAPLRCVDAPPPLLRSL